MVKPSRTMQPEGVDLKKAGRSSGKAFQEDSFRNYMARKIDLQRKQFGAVPPPPPPAPAKHHQKQPPSSGQSSSVSFDQKNLDSNNNNNEERPRKKRKKMSMSSILERLKRRHGGESSSSSRSLNLDKSSSSTGNVRAAPSINDEVAAAGKNLMTQAFPDTLDDEVETTIDTSMNLEPNGEEPAIETDERASSQVATAATTSTSKRKQHRPDLFFTGVVVIINGYTHPDVESLQRLLQQHGGDVERYETIRVTHVVAEHLSTAKAKLYAKQRKPKPVVHPSWIVECVKAQRLLPHAPYLIKEVRDLNQQPSVATFFQKARRTIATTDQETPPLQMEDEREISKELEHPKGKETSSSTVKHADTGRAGVVSADRCATEDSLMGEEEPLKETAARKQVYNPYAALRKSGAEKGDSSRQPTDEKHQVAAKSPPQQAPSRGRTDEKYINGQIRTVGTDPSFLETFFAESRLSFIGSFRQRATGRSTTAPLSETRSNDKPQNRYILHVDMDSFFAAVVLRNYPQYRDKPVAICHYGKGGPDGEVAKDSTSECATCNYHARKYGIQKGMFLGRARSLCPTLIVLPYDFHGYEEVSEQVSEICEKYAAEHFGVVEVVSCDESYMEVYAENASVVGNLAESIRRDIFDATKCTATIGIATNKFLAKLTTDHAKPDGWHLATNPVELLKKLSLRDLHGIGYRSEPKLVDRGFETVQDVWDRGNSAEHELQTILGKQLGTKIYNFCHGIDDRPVKSAGRQTIGAECNYGVRFNGPYGVDYMIEGLCKEVQKRMEHVGVKGTKVTLKVKQRKQGAKPPPKFLGHGSCHNLSKSHDTGRLTRQWEVMSQACKKMFRELKVQKDDVRGMGLIVSKLCEDGKEPTGGIQSFFQPMDHSSDKVEKDAAEAVAEGEADLCAKTRGGKQSSKDETRYQPNGNHGSVIEILESDDDDDDYDDEWDRSDFTQLKYLGQDILTQMSGSPGDVEDSGRKSKRLSFDTNVEEIDAPSDAPSDDANEIKFESVGTEGPVDKELESNSFRPELESIEIADIDDRETRVRSSEDSFDDIALPALSQIHMSQVDFLPSPMRRKVHARLAQHRAPSDDDMVNYHENDASTIPTSNAVEPAVLPPPKYRQTNVLRMMRLAAVKAGHADTEKVSAISLTQLDRLPVEVQLQVANNDSLSLGTHSPATKKAVSRSSLSTSLSRSKLGGKRVAASRKASRPAALTTKKGISRRPAEKKKKNPAPPPSDFTPPMSEEEFFRENILPLSIFMDEHLVTDETIGQVHEFIKNFVTEYSWHEVALILRSIRNRNDEWCQGHATGEIFDQVQAKFQQETGDELDVG